MMWRKGGMVVWMFLFLSVKLSDLSERERRLEGLRLYLHNMLSVHRSLLGKFPANCAEFLNSPISFRGDYFVSEPSEGERLRCVSGTPSEGEYGFALTDEGDLKLLLPGAPLNPVDKIPGLKGVRVAKKEAEQVQDYFLFTEALARHLDAAINEFVMVKNCYPGSFAEMEKVLGNLLRAEVVDPVTGESLRSLLMFTPEEMMQTIQLRLETNRKFLELLLLPPEEREQVAEAISYPETRRIYLNISKPVLLYFFSRPKFVKGKNIQRTFLVDRKSGNLGIAEVLRNHPAISICKE